MGFVRCLQALLLVSQLIPFHASLMTQRTVNCQNFKFVIDEDVIYNHILESHVFKRSTVHSAAQCHVKCKDDCLCVSMNYFPQSKENNCELNDVNRDMEPAAIKWKQGGNYYDLVRSYTVKGGENYVSGKHRCVNKCCSLNPCLNGGVCQEICDTHSTRFNCTCPEIYTGQRCGKISQITYPRSCKDIAKNGASAAGNYNIFNSADEPFSVYCDLQSEPGFVWALIQSFSIANKATFKDKGFGTDFPVNDNNNNKDWNSYRLSLARMQSLFQYSTHLRVTCNFPTDGLLYTDYARAVLRAGHDIFGNWNQDCKLFEYINIRGIHCSNCTADTRMESDKAWFVNSFKSKDKGCEFDGSPGAVDGENNFGMYHSGAINTNHRCSSSSSSTTQYWFGVKHE
ncbi:unnamed protein product [Pocillopora meandrina]|uniref:EGF-like domain-containing protein n=1 Tax=Pocillopora meandrina TaxID=46732 RepID=A0AAU9VYW0_9CNID|nr:unnamed protein product [Pocillopora meandrina]